MFDFFVVLHPVLWFALKVYFQSWSSAGQGSHSSHFRLTSQGCLLSKEPIRNESPAAHCLCSVGPLPCVPHHEMRLRVFLWIGSYSSICSAEGVAMAQPVLFSSFPSAYLSLASQGHRLPYGSDTWGPLNHRNGSTQHTLDLVQAYELDGCPAELGLWWADII